MEFNQIITKETLLRAGLTVIEGAMLLGISRPTFYNWQKGIKPRVLIQYRVACFSAALIATAVETGLLPLKSPPTDPNEKLEIVRNILKRIKQS